MLGPTGPKAIYIFALGPVGGGFQGLLYGDAGHVYPFGYRGGGYLAGRYVYTGAQARIAADCARDALVGNSDRLARGGGGQRAGRGGRDRAGHGGGAGVEG